MRLAGSDREKLLLSDLKHLSIKGGAFLLPARLRKKKEALSFL